MKGVLTAVSRGCNVGNGGGMCPSPGGPGCVPRGGASGAGLGPAVIRIGVEFERRKASPAGAVGRLPTVGK